MNNVLRALFALFVGLFSVAPAAAATLASSIPAAFSDGIDLSNVVTLVGVIGGSVIGVYLAVKLIKWVLMTFM